MNSFGGEALASVLSTVADMMNDLRSELTELSRRGRKALEKQQQRKMTEAVSHIYSQIGQVPLNLHGDSVEPRGAPGSHGD